jgi:hypothetical protein
MCLAAALAGAIAIAGAPAPAAAGTTYELAVGVSNAVVAGPPSDDLVHPGVAPLIGAVGWSLGERVSLGLRSATYLLPSTVAGRLEPFLATFIGPAISVWPARRLVIGAAAGPALVWPSPVGASPYLRTNRGLGLSLRASWAVGRAAAGDVLVGAELLPTVFDGGDLLIGSILTAGLSWR